MRWLLCKLGFHHWRLEGLASEGGVITEHWACAGCRKARAQMRAGCGG